MSKKKQNGHNGAPSFNPRAMEKMMRDLTKLVEGQEFDSIDDLNAFLAQYTGMSLPDLPPADDPPSQAGELIYKAYEAETREQALELVRQALEIYPDCADAYVLLADIDATSIEEIHDYYEKGVEAGWRALGPEMFEEHAGNFWYIHETRPFMRAMAGLAEAKWMMEETEKSIGLYREILRLNPGDNQGVRYMLADFLLEEERYEELMELFNEFEEDESANWLYNRALALFSMDGVCEASNTALDAAFAHNPFVPDFLLGTTKMPDEFPPFVGFGDESEAVEYAVLGIGNWRNTYGAIRWLRDQASKSIEEPRKKKPR